MLVDTHCHLSKADYDNIDNIIKEMDGRMIASGCNDSTNLEVLELINKYDNVYGTLGIHPEEIKNISEKSFEIIENNLNNPKIVAIGEIGLDYYYDSSNKEDQKKIFIRQLDLAEKYNKPIVVHSRSAINETYEILKKYNLKGSIHCFSSSVEMAQKFISLGYGIGVGGVVTFKNAKNIQEVVKKIDIENILLETDSPYLTPEPFRGQRNKPSNVYYVAKKISELKDINIEDIITKCYNNAVKIFDLK